MMTTTMTPEKQRFLASSAVASTNDWCQYGHDRTYCNLVGRRRNMRGDNSNKVFWDNDRNRLMIVKGRGICSNDFLASLEIAKSYL